MFSKQLLKEYLSFTQKDRIGAILIVSVVGSCLFLPRLLAPVPPPLALQEDSALVLAIDTLQQRQTQKQASRREVNTAAYPFERSTTNSFSAGELFLFDPNTISAADWQRLGLNERTSRTIINYVSKGGRFYEPEDLLKI